MIVSNFILSSYAKEILRLIENEPSKLNTLEIKETLEILLNACELHIADSIDLDGEDIPEYYPLAPEVLSKAIKCVDSAIGNDKPITAEDDVFVKLMRTLSDM